MNLSLACEPMLIGVVSDTHAPRFWKSMPTGVARALADVDLLLHAGDVCQPSVLDELSTLAPVRVVQGNNDGEGVRAWGATETLQLNAEGVRIAMVHDAGNKVGRLARMARRFPDAQLVIYGHSHIPRNDERNDDLWLFNPGSPTDKRRQPFRTLGLIEVSDGDIRRADIVTLP